MVSGYCVLLSLSLSLLAGDGEERRGGDGGGGDGGSRRGVDDGSGCLVGATAYIYRLGIRKERVLTCPSTDEQLAQMYELMQAIRKQELEDNDPEYTPHQPPAAAEPEK